MSRYTFKDKKSGKRTRNERYGYEEASLYNKEKKFKKECSKCGKFHDFKGTLQTYFNN